MTTTIPITVDLACENIRNDAALKEVIILALAEREKRNGLAAENRQLRRCIRDAYELMLQEAGDPGSFAGRSLLREARAILLSTGSLGKTDGALSGLGG